MRRTLSKISQGAVAVYDNLCGIFLDDISTREQLAAWFTATQGKQFSTIYALCFTGVCVA